MRTKEIIENMNSMNNSSRLLLESILVPEVEKALKDWINSSKNTGLLIGGLALSYFIKPRTTIDVDLLYLSIDNIPDTVTHFKRIRSHAFQHNETHVEIELLTPDFLNISTELVKAVIDNSVDHNGIAVPTREGLIALKLQRNEYQDKSDIQNLLRSGNVDISIYKRLLSDEQMSTFEEIKEKI